MAQFSHRYHTGGEPKNCRFGSFRTSFIPSSFKPTLCKGSVRSPMPAHLSTTSILAGMHLHFPHCIPPAAPHRHSLIVYILRSKKTTCKNHALVKTCPVAGGDCIGPPSTQQRSQNGDTTAVCKLIYSTILYRRCGGKRTFDLHQLLAAPATARPPVLPVRLCLFPHLARLPPPQIPDIHTICPLAFCPLILSLLSLSLLLLWIASCVHSLLHDTTFILNFSLSLHHVRSRQFGGIPLC